MTRMDTSFERNNRLISMGITLLIAILLFITFLFIKFITPIPPFGVSTQGGLEVNFGYDPAGMGNNNSLQEVTNTQKGKKEASVTHQDNSPSEMITTEDVSDVVVPPAKHKKIKKTTEVVAPPHPDRNLLNALNKVHNASENSSGDGNSDVPGNQGDLYGTINSNVYSEGGSGSGDRYRIRGKGRKMIGTVQIHDNSQETGIVAVEILVDKYGKIIKAEPVLMGSTTTSSVLWKKAKDGLLNQVLFNQSATGDEARGTIYINFTLR